jgi:hypothetical protein
MPSRIPDTESFATAQLLVDKTRTIALCEGRLVRKDPVDGGFIYADDYFAIGIAKLVQLEVHGQSFYDFEDGYVSDRMAGR